MDSSGKVVAHFQFDAFGVLLDGRENVTRYQFTGREHDSHTDYNYHRARWYDPTTGRWLSEDPIRLGGGDVNLSRYVGNGPTNGVDPSGLEADGPWWNNDGTDWVNPFAWKASRGDDLGTRIGKGYATVIVKDHSLEPKRRLLLMSSLIDDLSSSGSNTPICEYGRTRTSLIRQGLSEEFEDVVAVADGVVAAAELTVEVAEDVAPIGLVLEAKASKIAIEAAELAATGNGLESEGVTGEAIDAARLAQMKLAFERSGGAIDQSLDAQKYLRLRNADGLTFNAKTILLPERPTTTAVFEESIHTMQHRTGRFTQTIESCGNSEAIRRMEIEAAERLIINRKAWQIPRSETRQTIQRLRGLRSL